MSESKPYSTQDDIDWVREWLPKWPHSDELPNPHLAFDRIVEQLEPLLRIEAAAREFLTACDEYGCSDTPLDQYATLVEAVSGLPDGRDCPECGSSGEHGLGCPEGPSPLAGETMRSESTPAKRTH